MRKIKGFENYLIDENGNVYSLITHKAITPLLQERLYESKAQQGRYSL